MEKLLIKLEKYIAYSFVFLLPIFILPLFQNPYIVPKIILIVIACGLLIIVNIFKVLTGKKIKLSFGIFDLPVLLILVGYVIDTVIRTPDKMEAILFPGTATIIIASCLLYFLINQMEDRDRVNIKIFLLGGAAFSAIVVIISATGALQSTSITTFGGTLPAFIYFAALIPLSLNAFIKEKVVARKSVLGISLAIIAFGVAVAAFDVFTNKNIVDKLPDFKTSWYTTIDSLKENPLFGIGAGNYVTAFNRFRPISYNATDLWATRFTTSRSFYMTVVTETGLLGLIALGSLLASIYASYKKDTKEKKLVGWSVIENGNFASLLLLTLLLFLFPSFISTTILIFILLSISAKVKTKNIEFLSKNDNQATRLIAVSPFVIFVLVCWFYGVKMVLAESKYQEVLKAVSSNQAKISYDLMRDTININPYVDRYRISYSQLNLALALSITKKTSLSDDDKNIVSQLIQQSIREAKVAAVINPERSGIWQNLGTIYKTIIPMAKDADQFALQSFTQAITLDPGDVNNRINLGSVYFTQKNYESAIDSFKLAVVAKPDHANAHYNLGLTYKAKGDSARATAEFNAVLTLVPQNSDDYKLVKKELDGTQAEAKSTTLTQPQPSSAPLNPKLDLGSEASPAASPAAESSPAPINP